VNNDHSEKKHIDLEAMIEKIANDPDRESRISEFWRKAAADAEEYVKNKNHYQPIMDALAAGEPLSSEAIVDALREIDVNLHMLLMFYWQDYDNPPDEDDFSEDAARKYFSNFIVASVHEAAVSDLLLAIPDKQVAMRLQSELDYIDEICDGLLCDLEFSLEREDFEHMVCRSHEILDQLQRESLDRLLRRKCEVSAYAHVHFPKIGASKALDVSDLPHVKLGYIFYCAEKQNPPANDREANERRKKLWESYNNEHPAAKADYRRAVDAAASFRSGRRKGKMNGNGRNGHLSN
jgi:hypothetical protein